MKYALWFYGHWSAIVAIVAFGLSCYNSYLLREDRKPRVTFSLILLRLKPVLRIFNLGKIPVVVEEIRILICNDDYFQGAANLQLNPSSVPIDWAIPSEVYLRIVLTADLEVSLRFTHSSGKSRWTRPQGFNLVGGKGRFAKVRTSFHHLRYTECPKCKSQIAFDVQGLNNENEVSKRKSRVQKGLRKLCPHHPSFIDSKVLPPHLHIPN